MQLGKQLQKLRKARNKSIRAMAKISGLSNPFLCQVENATDDTWLAMSMLSLLRIVRAYRLPFDDVVAQLVKHAEKKKDFPEASA